MATYSSGNGCGSTNGTKQVGTLAASPFVSVRYHFGMLLGVDDFETDQAYHRGKTWLHSSWLHGSGTVWGLGVKLGDGTDPEIALGELLVEPGLALDGCGRELSLGEKACVSLAAWYAKHKDDEDLAAVVDIDSGEGGPSTVTFNAVVVARFSACKWREVPALVEPCAGSASDTQFSRYNETVELRIVPVDSTWKPDWAARYHRLRVLLGVEAPNAEDGDLVSLLQEIAALPAAERGPARLTAFRALAAKDVMDLAPTVDPETGESAAPFAGLESEGVVLAHLTDITLEEITKDDVTTWSYTSGTANNLVRRSLVSTQGIQELLAGDSAEAAAAVGSAGPQFNSEIVFETGTNNLLLSATKPLHPGTVVPDAFSITSLSPLNDNNAFWKEHTIVAVTYNSALSVVTLTLDDITLLPLNTQSSIRIVARGTGPMPIAGTDGLPLAGAVGSTVQNSFAGQDFVAVIKGSVS